MVSVKGAVTGCTAALELCDFATGAVNVTFRDTTDNTVTASCSVDVSSRRTVPGVIPVADVTGTTVVTPAVSAPVVVVGVPVGVPPVYWTSPKIPERYHGIDVGNASPSMLVVADWTPFWTPTVDPRLPRHDWSCSLTTLFSTSSLRTGT